MPYPEILCLALTTMQSNLPSLILDSYQLDPALLNLLHALQQQQSVAPQYTFMMA